MLVAVTLEDRDRQGWERDDLDVVDVPKLLPSGGICFSLGFNRFSAAWNFAFGNAASICVVVDSVFFLSSAEEVFISLFSGGLKKLVFFHCRSSGTEKQCCKACKSSKKKRKINY